MKSNKLAGQRRRAGFALIDLTVTVLIIGIVAAVAVPRFTQSLDIIRADSAARHIVADLNYARHRAQMSSRSVPVNFTQSPASYAMPTTPHLNRSGATYSVNLPDAGLNVQLAVNIQGTKSVTYNNYGLPLAGSPLVPVTSGTITVQSGAASKVVLINAQTGRASVQ
jgi:Tfp pilus assembly protein FimT